MKPIVEFENTLNRSQLTEWTKMRKATDQSVDLLEKLIVRTERQAEERFLGRASEALGKVVRSEEYNTRDGVTLVKVSG